MISNLYLQRKCGGTEKCDHSCPALQSVEVPGATIDQKSCVMLKKKQKKTSNTPPNTCFGHILVIR